MNQSQLLVVHVEVPEAENTVHTAFLAFENVEAVVAVYQFRIQRHPLVLGIRR